jgi:hypothetical protein
MVEPSQGRLPDFVVIGAPKAATTSLDFYLALHPEIHMARPKEPRYFDDSRNGRWHLGVDWYRSLFQSSKRLCGEASPAYAVGPRVGAVPQRMAELIPHAKLIYLVREPFRRLESQYLMAFRRQWTQLSFEEYLRAIPQVRAGSQYGSRLREFLEFYPRDQILILESAALGSRTAEVMRQVYAFLGADPEFRSPLFNHWRNTSAMEVTPTERGRRILKSGVVRTLSRWLPSPVFYHLRNLILLPFRGPSPSLELPPTLRQELREEFQDEVALLRQLTGLALPSLDEA